VADFILSPQVPCHNNYTQGMPMVCHCVTAPAAQCGNQPELFGLPPTL